MNSPARQDTAARQWISDLVDGRLDDPDAARGCAGWAQDAGLRRTWHAYHLIGDVLRSDDLAVEPAHDADFLASLRARLAQEPVVLAPARAPRAPRQVWLVPVAVAAGFVAVAGVLVVLRQATPGPDAAGPMVAEQANTGATQVRAAPLVAGPPRVADPRMNEYLRDARIDDYLRAHRETLAGSPAVLPGGAMRSVDLTVPQR